MSWRPSNSNSRPSYESQHNAHDHVSGIDPTMRIIIIAAVAIAVIAIGVIIAINLASRQGSSSATTIPPTSAAAVASPTVAATATKAATSAAASGIVSSRATATPAPTISPADAGPEETHGDAVAGKTLFNGMPTDAITAGAVTCSTCHNVDPGSGTLIGPSLSGVATRAETRVAILSPAQYLRTSIVAPNSYVVEGFVPGTMTQTFEAALTPAQIEDLVAYLRTLK